MQVNPQQTDPQFQDPRAQDSAQQSQIGMDSQDDEPLAGMGSSAAEADALGASVAPGAIVVGAEVYGTDGKKFGTVQQVYATSFLARKGIFFTHDYDIPLSYVVGADHQRVTLGVPADAV